MVGFTPSTPKGVPSGLKTPVFLTEKKLDGDRKMSPTIIQSNHVSPHCMSERLLGYLAAGSSREPFTGPDQQALEGMIQKQERE
jgi:hypothetical protein